MSNPRARVAVLRTSPETVLDDYGRLLRLAGVHAALPAGPEVILKVHLGWHHFLPACSTPPWQLEGVIRALLAEGFPREKVLVCQNGAPGISARRGELRNRHRAVLEKYGLRNLHLDEGQDSVVFRPSGSLMVLGDLFPGGFRVPRRLVGQNVIHLPTLKTDVRATLSGAVKNALGALVLDRRGRTGSVLHETLVDLLALSREVHPGTFAVMDGTFVGEGPGPRCLRPYVKDTLLASADLLALDAIAARLMGFDPLAIPFIRLAHERGLGVGDPREIEVVGEDVSRVSFGFRAPASHLPRRLEQLVFEGPLRPLEKRILRPLLAPLTSLLSWLYHDLLWFPLWGKDRVRDMSVTKWGRLFDTYRHGGVASPFVSVRAAEQPSAAGAA
jgi:uncharacterized protein (DUF362 family)